MKHEDRCTLLKNGGVEADYLQRPLHDVCMRLFYVNKRYRNMVREAAFYIQYQAMHESEGYKKPHGFSGANGGIPWNIIALADGTIMINPIIVRHSTNTKESFSNCGSLLLEKSVKIRRYVEIQVEYYDENGIAKSVVGYLPTVQHEIDHNNGILITDRVVT